MLHTGSERAMKTPGDLVSFVREEYHKYKDGARGFQYEMKYVLACHHEKTEEMTTHLQLMQLLQLVWQLTITSLTFLFAALMAVDNNSRDSGPPGHGKTTCGNDEDALQYLNKFSWVMASTRSRILNIRSK